MGYPLCPKHPDYAMRRVAYGFGKDLLRGNRDMYFEDFACDKCGKPIIRRMYEVIGTVPKK